MFSLKQGDTSPPFRGKAKDATGKLVPLTGATATFRMKPQIQGLRAPISAPADVDGLTSELSYDWASDGSDTNVPGLYDAEFHVVFADGSEETFPNGEYEVVEILPAA